jgi:hypothetical protein
VEILEHHDTNFHSPAKTVFFQGNRIKQMTEDFFRKNLLSLPPRYSVREYCGFPVKT